MDFKNIVQMICQKKNVALENPLQTIWSEQVDNAHVLEEYPRPQLRREEYTNLNGYWDYCITSEHDQPEKMDGKILVPFSPESPLSGVNRMLQPGEILWYRRTVTIPKVPAHRRCLLHFGAVDQICQVYINGYKVRDHVGGYLAFECEIQEYLLHGDNEILLKVTDDTSRSYHSRGKQSLTPGGMLYTAQSGVWQTVWMEWVPVRYIKGMKITPHYDENKLTIAFKLSEHRSVISGETSTPIKVTVYDQEKAIFEKTYHKKTIQLHLPPTREWTPEDPYLYDIKIEYGDDKVSSYFAMRKFSVEEDKEGIPRICLNNKPYYQRGVLDQGYWPDGLYTAPTDAAMIYDIVKMKELGYNMIRKHIKIEPSRWYYHCDQLGMIVWQDMVNGGGPYKRLWVSCLPAILPTMFASKKDNNYTRLSRRDEHGRAEWKRECWNTVNQLYHFPCIATWVLFNEGWGQFDAEDMVRQIKKHDKTRLVDHASGWFDQGCGDIKSVHNYIRKQEITAIDKHKRAYAITEFGGYAYGIKGHRMTDQYFGYATYHTKEELNKAYQNLYKEEITPLIKKGLSASVYTQLSDVEGEMNGLLTYDRKVCKVDPLP